MPRKSAVAAALPDPRGRRLEPPPDLPDAVREAFLAAVNSVRPAHFAAEETPLLVAYAAAVVQQGDIIKRIEKARTATAKANLWTSHGRVAGTLVRLARALRMGPLARNPSRNTRRPGTVEPSGELPWEWTPEDEPTGQLN